MKDEYINKSGFYGIPKDHQVQQLLHQLRSTCAGA
jgi:hypothetical protein